MLYIKWESCGIREDDRGGFLWLDNQSQIAKASLTHAVEKERLKQLGPILTLYSLSFQPSELLICAYESH